MRTIILVITLMAAGLAGAANGDQSFAATDNGIPAQRQLLNQMQSQQIEQQGQLQQQLNLQHYQQQQSLNHQLNDSRQRVQRSAP